MVGLPLGYGTIGAGEDIMATVGDGTVPGDGIAGTVGAGAEASVGAEAGAGTAGAGQALERGVHPMDTITALTTLAMVEEIMRTTNPEGVTIEIQIRLLGIIQM